MNLIVAADRNWGIGKDGDQLVYIPEDMRHFRAMTKGHAVIVGRKTLATFPAGRPLAGRRNLILSTREDFHPEGAEVFRSMDDLLAVAPDDAFVVGGEQVYRSMMIWCDYAYVTRIDAEFEADRFFPDLDRIRNWKKIRESPVLEDEGLRFRYVTYMRTGV